MAEKLDPTIKMLLTNFPDCFKLADLAPGKEITPMYFVRGELDRGIPITKTGRKLLDHISRAGIALDDKESRPDFTDISPNADTKDFGFHHSFGTAAATPSKSKEDKVEPDWSSLTELASPDNKNKQVLSDWLSKLSVSSDKSPAEHSISSPPGHALAQRASTLSYQRPGAAPLRNEIRKEKQQTPPNFQLELPATSNQSPALCDIRSLLSLNHAIVRRASILNCAKPGTSPLRNGIHSASVDDDKLAQNKSEGSLPNTNVLNQPFEFRGRAKDQNATPFVGMWADAVEVEKSAADAQVFTNRKGHKVGATQRKKARQRVKRTGQAHANIGQGAVDGEDTLKPPVEVGVDADGITEITLNLPPLGSRNDQPHRVKTRAEGIWLTPEEWLETPDEFSDFDERFLTRFWDFAYDPVVCKTVLNYKKNLALAGKANEVLDWPNRLLLALVEVQEAEVGEGASRRKLSTATFPEESAKPTRFNILQAAIGEVYKTFGDPSYNITTKRERFALSKGVKLDSQLTEKLTQLFFDLYTELHTPPSAFEMATSTKDKKKIMAETMLSLESKAFGEGKKEKSGLVIEEPAVGKAKGKEGDGLMQGSTSTKGNGKENGIATGKGKKIRLPKEDAATGTGKAEGFHTSAKGSTNGTDKDKESEMLLKDPPTKKRRNHRGKSKKIKLPVNDTATGKIEDQKRDSIAESSTTNKGKGKERELLTGCLATGKNENGVNHLPLADSKGEGEGESVGPSQDEKTPELLRRARDLFFDPRAIITTEKALYILMENAGTIVDEERFMNNALQSWINVYDIMERFIRPQLASAPKIALYCRKIRQPECFVALIPLTDELQWNRAVVEHPYNPMISYVLRWTAHLRPTDGLHHSSGISVAPLLVPRYPPVPPGPAPVTPAITMYQRERPSILNRLKDASTKKKSSFEDRLKELDHREAILLAKMKTEFSESVVKALDDCMALGKIKADLKEKARLEKAGGKIADRLAQRLKKMAEDDGVPPYTLP